MTCAIDAWYGIAPVLNRTPQFKQHQERLVLLWLTAANAALLLVPYRCHEPARKINGIECPFTGKSVDVRGVPQNGSFSLLRLGSKLWRGAGELRRENPLETLASLFQEMLLSYPGNDNSSNTNALYYHLKMISSIRMILRSIQRQESSTYWNQNSGVILFPDINMLSWLLGLCDLTPPNYFVWWGYVKSMILKSFSNHNAMYWSLELKRMFG